MSRSILIQTTGIVSLIIQFCCGVLNVWGLRLRIKTQGQIFHSLLLIEFIVQVVEFFAYLFLISLFFQKNLDPQKVMTIRYTDWMVTTPTMLVTLMAFLSNESSFFLFIKKYKKSIMTVLLLDWGMLYCGYKNEVNVDYNSCQKKLWIYRGFFFFFFMFAWIYYLFQKQIHRNVEKQLLFTWFFILWMLYGIVAFNSFTFRNTSYNILDLFSKNITGIFLVWKLNQFRM